MDREAVETAVRLALHRAGAAALTELLQFPAPAGDQRQMLCRCGQSARYRGLRSRPLLTAPVPPEVSRPYYLCPHFHTGQFPADVKLDIEDTEFSPGVRRMQAVVGQGIPFEHDRRQMEVLAGLEVNAKSVEGIAEAVGEDIARWEVAEIGRAVQLDLPVVLAEPVPVLCVEMDGTGVPVVKKETLGRKGRQEGEPAHTRAAKLGCVFTQTRWDEKGYAIRDPASTTYVGAIEAIEEFGKQLYVKAWKRGWSRVQKKVVLGDGAERAWNLVQQHFPGAIQIVDLARARQHLWDQARKLHPNDEATQKRWIRVQKNRLDKGKIEKLVPELRVIRTCNPELAEELRKQTEYFQTNAERMGYPRFRDQHLFVGSGVIEAGGKSVIGARLKRSGMFWAVRGAHAILALHCCQLDGRFEDYWETRRVA